MRRPRATTLAAAALAACSVAAYLGVGLLRTSTAVEYNGHCGRSRVCEKRRGSFGETCREDTPFRSCPPFGRYEECDAEWYVVSGVNAAPDPQAAAINALATLHLFEATAVRDQRAFADPAIFLDSVREELKPYASGECRGRKTGAGPTGYTAVLVANLDLDPDLDCWAIDESGELRHLWTD